MEKERQEFKIGGFGIILDEQKRVLLCHRTDKDLWNLPGGGLESNESPWDGVKREVREETGLEVDIEKLLGIYSKPQKNEIVFLFLCEVTGGEITLNSEATDIQYFDEESIPSNIPEKHIERIHDALKESSEIVLKIQKDK
jgi:ADP-ribose pyrophosphatase YjhB (NUDIX family)